MYKEKGKRIFTQYDNDRRRRNGFKKEGRFMLDVRQKFFTQKAVRPWHSCPEKLRVPHATSEKSSPSMFSKDVKVWGR